jgi:hypothetical protein
MDKIPPEYNRKFEWLIGHTRSSIRTLDLVSSSQLLQTMLSQSRAPNINGLHFLVLAQTL